MLHRLFRQVFGVGVAGGLAAQHAHAQAQGHAAARRLDLLFFVGVAGVVAVLEEQVGVVAATRKRRREQSPRQLIADVTKRE